MSSNETKKSKQIFRSSSLQLRTLRGQRKSNVLTTLNEIGTLSPLIPSHLFLHRKLHLRFPTLVYFHLPERLSTTLFTVLHEVQTVFRLDRQSFPIKNRSLTNQRSISLSGFDGIQLPLNKILDLGYSFFPSLSSIRSNNISYLSSLRKFSFR